MSLADQGNGFSLDEMLRIGAENSRLKASHIRIKEYVEALTVYLRSVSPHIASRAEFMVLYDAIQKELK